MKLEKKTSGSKKVTISKTEWFHIGKQAGWIKIAEGYSSEMPDDISGWGFVKKHNFLMSALKKGLSNFKEYNEYYNVSGFSHKPNPERAKELEAVLEPQFDAWMSIFSDAQRYLKMKCPDIIGIRWRGKTVEITTKDGGLYMFDGPPFESKNTEEINLSLDEIANSINNATKEEKSSAQWKGTSSKGMASYYSNKKPGDYTGD